MDSKTFQFKLRDLVLDVPMIEKVIGYKDGESHEPVSDLIREVIYEAENECKIKAEYSIFPISSYNEKDKTIEVNSITFDLKKVVYGQIKRSESVAVFLCTAGEWIGRMSKESMQEGDMLKGYIYDIIGSEIADMAADLMQDRLKEALAHDRKNITNRYSPGYCEWNVSEQHKLFRLLPDNYCGIRLTTSALMDPIKSVSGIIGIGEKVRYNPYTCNLCDMKDCLYRRLRNGK